jgi:hypothetical protein
MRVAQSRLGVRTTLSAAPGSWSPAQRAAWPSTPKTHVGQEFPVAGDRFRANYFFRLAYGLSMRAMTVLIPILVGLSVVGAFAAGRYVGSQESEKMFSTLAVDIDGRRSVEALFVVNTAIERLQDSKFDDAHRILVRYAKLQIPAVTACSKSPMCVVFTRPMLQSSAQLQKVEALDEHTAVTR